MECKVGTPGYQAPEIANGATVTPAIDMWSYGVLLHELAVGYKPVAFTGVIKLNENHWQEVDQRLISLI
jgi:serine/threonine protein kinase